MKRIKHINKDSKSDRIEIIFENDTKMLVDSSQCCSAIEDQTRFDKAKSIAVRFVSLRLKTKQEVCNKLIQYGYTMDICDKVCDELQNQGYINDYEYCIKYISHSKKLKNMSTSMIIYNLKNKGIDEDLIYEAIKQSDINDMDSAIILLSKKYKKNCIRDINENRKALAYLINKGFSYECSKMALETFKNSFH